MNASNKGLCELLVTSGCFSFLSLTFVFINLFLLDREVYLGDMFLTDELLWYIYCGERFGTCSSRCVGKCLISVFPFFRALLSG